MLIRIPGVFDADTLARARALLVEAPWTDGAATAGGQAAHAKHNQQLPVTCAPAQALQSMVLGALERHPVFFSAALPKRVFPPMFNRYGGTANTYGAHVDNAIRYVPGRGEPVTRGFRVASFFWIESLVRSDEQRRLLHDMDRFLVHLRSTVGETDPGVVGLTGTYHNLLRQWADT